MKLSRFLAGAAVVVGLPRYIVSQAHIAGFPAPVSETWATLVVVSAVAWAALEALTLYALWDAYAKRATTDRGWRLIGFMVAILVLIGATNTPSAVADSAGLSITALLGVATPAHVAWAWANITANLLVVLAAGAADGATRKIEDEAAEWRRRANELAEKITDKADGVQVGVQVNVNPPATVEATPGLPPDKTWTATTITRPRKIDPARLQALLAADPDAPAHKFAAVFGVSDNAIRKTAAWARHQAAK